MTMKPRESTVDIGGTDAEAEASAEVRVPREVLRRNESVSAVGKSAEPVAGKGSHRVTNAEEPESADTKMTYLEIGMTTTLMKIEKSSANKEVIATTTTKAITVDADVNEGGMMIARSQLRISKANGIENAVIINGTDHAEVIEITKIGGKGD